MFNGSGEGEFSLEVSSRRRERRMERQGSVRREFLVVRDVCFKRRFKKQVECCLHYSHYQLYEQMFSFVYGLLHSTEKLIICLEV